MYIRLEMMETYSHEESLFYDICALHRYITNTPAVSYETQSNIYKTIKSGYGIETYYQLKWNKKKLRSMKYYQLKWNKLRSMKYKFRSM
jgi:hypothetical protein